MTKYNSIDEQMNTWGREAQQLPAGNDTLKQNLLSVVRPAQNQAPAKRPRQFFYRFAILATATVAILIVMASPNLFRNAAGQTERFYRGSSVPVDLGLSYGAATGLGSKDENLIQKISDSFKTKFVEEDALMLDTREYLDTSYYATINTREVKKLSDLTKTIIRGHFGRIDSISEQPKSARISFSLPKTELDNVILELKDLAPEKMYLETTYADNRLPDKQKIETDTGNAVDELNRLQTERSTTVASYEKQLSAAQGKIDSLNRSINADYARRTATTNTVKLAEINSDIGRLLKEKTSAEQQWQNLQKKQKSALAVIDSQIKNQNAHLDDLGEKDSQLTADVETVTGTINIQWISIWGTINTYIPMRPLIIFIIIIGAIFLMLRRRPAPLTLPV